VNGPKLYYVLAIPVVIAGVPLLLRARTVRVVSALLLMGWVVAGSASVGLLYLPSAVMMILAARVKS
jgi:lipid-binding SYLF domain-containing protein